MKEKLLIIDRHPYGLLTDSYKWCEYLRKDYDITLLTLRTNKSFPAQDGIKHYPVFYDEHSFIKRLKALSLFILLSFWLSITFRGKIFIVYFPTCYWLKKLIFWKRMHLDIRTLSVNNDSQKRNKYNNKLIKTCKIFNSVSVISEGIKAIIGRDDISILPLGADIISTSTKKYDSEIRLLYIGTFRARNIPATIKGIDIFLNSNPHAKIRYDIIGSGSDLDNHEVDDCIKKYNLQNIVTYHGYLSHSQSKAFFDSANIGCAYVPITEYFENQPPTKIFEYSMSGLYTIATKTKANSKFISDNNGELIDDSAVAFSQALETYLSKQDSLNETTIRNSLKQYSWKNIVDNNLKKLLKKL